jgi:AcrR family transcriptional regulator
VRARKPAPAPKATRRRGGEEPRVARRERRRAQSREEILEAARRVIVRDGFSITLERVAEEVGLTKAALYYYFPSKDALLFELVFRIHEREAKAIHDAVDAAEDGRAALAALIGTTVERYAERMEDFRLAFLHGQVAGARGMRMRPEYFARIRPLNELTYGAAERKLASGRDGDRSPVSARRLVFLAHLAAIGLLTVKGMVESVDDPLLYSDRQLVADLTKIFEQAAPASKRTLRRSS